MSFEEIDLAEVQKTLIKIKRTPFTSKSRKGISSLALEGDGNSLMANHFVHPRTKVLTIVSKFYNKGEDNVKQRNGNHRGELSDEKKEYFFRKVDENCFLSFSKLVSIVYGQFKVSVSKSTIDRCLREFHYTIKSVLTVLTACNPERTINLRYVYAQEFRQLKSFLLFYEVGFKVCTEANKRPTVIASIPQASIKIFLLLQL